MIRLAGLRTLLTVVAACFSAVAAANGSAANVAAPTASVDRSYCVYNRTKQHQVTITAKGGSATLGPGMQACCAPNNGLCNAPQAASWVVEVRGEGKRVRCAPGADRNAPIQLERPGSYLLIREGRMRTKAGSDRAPAELPSVEVDVMSSDAHLVGTITCRSAE